MKYNFWFVVGSQDLYGEAVLKTVAQRAGGVGRIVIPTFGIVSAGMKL